MGLKEIYETKYKALLIIPFLLLTFAILQIGVQYAQTGEIMNRGVSLKGGISIALSEKYMPPHELEEKLLSQFPGSDISVRAISTTGLVIDAADLEQNLLMSALEKEFRELGEYSAGEIGSSLGESFFRETITALIIAFILMGIVVFITFRVPAPSLAVILAAFSDIVVTLAIVNLLNVKISTAGIAAFLMLIGYSVDTDILLSTRVLKRKEGTVMERVYSAMSTGLMMNGTTLAALLVALFISQSDTISQIMLILIIGLLVDIVMTWIQNVGILRMHLEKKEKRVVQ